MALIRNLVFLFALFSTIYPVIWVFFPVAFSRLFGVFGILYAIFFLRSSYVISNYRKILIGFSFLFFIAILQYTVNDIMDIEFVKHVLTIPILNFFVGLLLYAIAGKEGHSFGRLCDFILIAAVIQAFVSFLMFLSPELTNFIQSLIVFDERTEERREMLTHRLMGLGQAFWGAGINYGVDILIITMLPDLKNSLIYKNKILYWSITAIIILAGILSARTFFISFLFVVLYFVLMRKNIIQTIINSYKYILIIPIFFFLYQMLESQLGALRFRAVESFVFELFNNYEETGEIESGSTNILKNMYSILPTSTKTWVIGDGHYQNPDGSYYMHTDIGHSRQIFFYGLIGLITYWLVLLYVYIICQRQYRLPAIKIFIWVFLLFEFILNFKAFATLSSYLGMFLAWGLMNRDKELEYIKSVLFKEKLAETK